ncbi:MAG TPA: DUF1320 family protein [Candidatus Cloacimonadota bacterium]|nr:DUF1320 family protein [Candidatus Cloacimonadota bacterium]
MYGDADKLKAAIGFQCTAMQGTVEDDDFVAILEGILDDEAALIDEMIQTRVDLTTVSSSAVLQQIALQLAVYAVWKKYARNQMPEHVSADKREAMKMLTDIQQGRIRLTTVTDDEGEDVMVESEFEEGQTQVFSTMLL